MSIQGNIIVLLVPLCWKKHSSFRAFFQSSFSIVFIHLQFHSRNKEAETFDLESFHCLNVRLVFECCNECKHSSHSKESPLSRNKLKFPFFLNCFWALIAMTSALVEWKAVTLKVICRRLSMKIISVSFRTNATMTQLQCLILEIKSTGFRGTTGLFSGASH